MDAYRVHLHHWRKANGEPLTLSAQSAKLGAVLSFLRYLHEEKLVLVNPGHGVRLPKCPDKLLPQLPDEARTSTPSGDTRRIDAAGVGDRAILELLYSSAIRNTELRLLELDHVDLVRLEARIECGKGRKGRVVPFGEPAAHCIEAYLRDGRPWLVRDSNTKPVFLNTLGRTLSAELLSEIVRGACEEGRAV